MEVGRQYIITLEGGQVYYAYFGEEQNVGNEKFLSFETKSEKNSVILVNPSKIISLIPMADRK